MSGCWTSWVSESLCRLAPSSCVALPDWLAFLQGQDTDRAVTSRPPVERILLAPHTSPPNWRAEGGPGRWLRDPALRV